MQRHCAVYNKSDKLWSNVKQQKQQRYFSDRIGQLILNSLSVNGTKVAQINVDNGVQMSYHELWLKTVRAAQNLQTRGIQSRQPFSFMVNHTDDLVPIVLASMCLACPVNALHPLLSTLEIVRILDKTKPSVIFCDINEYNRIDEAVKEANLIVKIFTFDGHVDGHESVDSLFTETGIEQYFVPIDVDAENDIAGIFCSSGTTGPSKRLGISYGMCMYWICEEQLYDANSIFLCFDSVYWSIGLYAILACIKSGATRIITAKPYDPVLQLSIIQEYKVTHLWTGLFQLTACLKNELISNTNLSSVQQIRSYGSKMLPSIVNEINRYFSNATTHAWYGMTEIGVVSQCSFEFDANNSGGQLALGCIAKIIDDNGDRCGPNTMGELCIKKEYKFLGYLDDSALTAAAIDSDGFLKTGDIGYFDENGTLFIKDRKKNTILNVFYFRGMILPSEIEEYLISLPGIKEVCVVGVPITAGSELPAAIIVRMSNSSLTQQEIFDAVADQFPERYQLRAGVYFVNSLPKLPAGKPMRKQITQMAVDTFSNAKHCDSFVKSFLSDIPHEFRNLL